MKNSIKNLLRAGVFALAAVFAFAFTKPLDSTPLYQEINGVVEDVSGLNYRCDNPQNEICTYQDPELTIPAQMGRFSLIP